MNQEHGRFRARLGGPLDDYCQIAYPCELRRHSLPHSLVENASNDGEYIAMQPMMEPYRRHIIVCTGGFCSPNRGGRELYALLPELLEREGLLFGPGRVKRGETPCLGVCAGGPIVVIYPEGVWYGGVTPALLDRIVVEHLRDGRVLDDFVFFRL